MFRIEAKRRIVSWRSVMSASGPTSLAIEEVRVNEVSLASALKEVAEFRHEPASLFGADAPKSAALLIDMLAQTEEPSSRQSLYRGAIMECLRAGCLPAAERAAVTAHEEFRDIVSLVLLSRTLADVGKLSEALVAAKSALDQAVREKVVVNYAAGELMRVAVRTGSVDAVNESLDLLVASTQAPRTDDCVLETDWVSDAEALGADRELTDWVREVAAGLHR